MSQKNQELGTGAGFIVVLSRVAYSGAVAVAVTVAIGHYGLGWTLPPSTTLIQAGLWVALFAPVALVTIGVGFPLWVAMSWGTGWLFCPSIRASWREFNQSNKTNKEEGA